MAQQIGARSATGRRRSELRWLPWLLLLVLALVVVGIILLIANVDDEDDGAAVSRPPAYVAELVRSNAA